MRRAAVHPAGVRAPPHDAARASGATLLPAFGYDYLPGTLAAAIALEHAGEQATPVETGYFLAPHAGDGRAMPRAGLRHLGYMTTGGTRASWLTVLFEPAYARREGRLVDRRAAQPLKRFTVAGQRRAAINVGSSEPFALPQAYPRLRDVETDLGWFGNASPAMTLLGALGTPLVGSRHAIDATFWLAKRLPGASHNPSEETMRTGRSLVVAIANDASGRELARTELHGPEPYTLTAELLAWAADGIATNGTPRPEQAVHSPPSACSGSPARARRSVSASQAGPPTASSTRSPTGTP